jgi:predicted phage terminase large subunit-like protein
MSKIKKLREKYLNNWKLLAFKLFKEAFVQKYGIPIYAEAAIDLALKGYKKIVVIVPRKHAKSTFITFLYVMISILSRKKRYVLIVSNTKDQAIMFIERIKFYLSSPIIRTLFPHLDGDIEDENIEDNFLENTGNIKQVWSAKKIRLPSGQMVAATGITSSMRGLININYRPDLIIGDDIEDKNNTNTPDLRKKLIHSFYEVIIPMGADDCQYIILGTISTKESLLDILYNNSTWKSIKLEGIEEREEYKKKLLEFNPAIKYRFDEIDSYENPIEWEGIRNGIPIWHERYDLDYFITKHKDFKESGVEDSFWQEYFNRAKSLINKKFQNIKYKSFILKKSNGINYLFSENPNELFANDENSINVNLYCGVDFAYTEKETSDYTVFATIGIDPFGWTYLVDLFVDRISIDMIEEVFWKKYFQYRWKAVGIDANANQTVMSYLLQRKMNKTINNILYPKVKIIELQSRKEKIARISSVLSSYWDTFYITDKIGGYVKEDMESQFKHLGNTNHDDIVDAISNALEIASSPSLIRRGDLHYDSKRVRHPWIKEEKKPTRWYLR